jgi:ATP-binding cassette subfamily C protein
MLIVLIFSRLWPRFTAIQSSWEQIGTTVPAFQNVLKLMKDCEEAREWNTADQGQFENPIHTVGEIECRHVWYRYDRSQPVFTLRDIHVRIPGNSMTAIVGKSGAGKSTLIDLLIGLNRPESGKILINGEPYHDANKRAIRSSIGYVSQDPFLFHASIRDNLLLVKPDASEEQLWKALEASASDEFVKNLPQGIDTVVGDRGVRLSGGERQRIVLARALLKNPAILVLDEATSALDNENEAKIQAALNRLKGKITIIVIAHRLSTIRNADQVVVLENGCIIQQGGYQQLSRETGGVFSQMLKYQAGAH